MEESTLLRVSVVCSIIGLVVLYIISGQIKIDEASISRISQGQEGNVLVKGKVTRVTDSEKVVFFDIESSEKISAFAFKKGSQMTNSIKVNDIVEIKGEVQESEGKSQILASEIRVVG